MLIDPQRVTAGLPAVTPHLRKRKDTIEKTRAASRQNLLDERGREALSLADDAGAPTTSLMAQLGRPLSSRDVIQRLQRMNRNLHFERANADPSKYGVYVIERRPDPVTGLWGTMKRHLCGMEAGYMPEFTVRHATTREVPDPDVRGHWTKISVPTGITPGWRRVLAVLLKERMVTKPQIERYFNAHAGRSSANWQAQTT